MVSSGFPWPHAAIGIMNPVGKSKGMGQVHGRVRGGWQLLVSRGRGRFKVLTKFFTVLKSGPAVETQRAHVAVQGSASRRKVLARS